MNLTKEQKNILDVVKEDSCIELSIQALAGAG